MLRYTYIARFVATVLFLCILTKGICSNLAKRKMQIKIVTLLPASHSAVSNEDVSKTLFLYLQSLKHSINNAMV